MTANSARTAPRWRTLWLLPAAIVLFIFEFIGDGAGGQGYDVRRYMTTAAVLAIALAIYWCVVRLLVGRPVTELPAGRAIPHTVLGIVIGLILFGVILGVLALSGTYSLHVSGRSWPPLAGPALVAAAMAGVFEELVMRGALLQLVERFAGSWVGLIVSSIVFGVLHFANQGAGPWLLVSIALSGGLLFGAAFLYTRNLWLAIGLHFAFDTAEKFLGTPGETPGLLHFTQRGPDLLTGGTAGLEASTVTVVVCVALSIALLIGATARGHMMPVRRRLSPAPKAAPV
jgi:uncharacterized protein